MFPPLVSDLEVKLQCEFDYAPATFVLNLTEVVDGVLREAEATSRIANVGNVATVSVGTTECAIALRLQREKDVTVGRVCRSDIDLSRIRLVEYIEKSGAELNLLLFSDVEVLEEGDVKVAPAGSTQVERWLRGPAISETWYGKLRKIKDFVSQFITTDLRIAEIDWSDCANTGPRVGAVERIGAIPTNRLTRLRNRAGKSQANRGTALNRRYA